MAFGTWQVGSARQLFNQSQTELAADEDAQPAAATTEEMPRRCKFGMNGPSVSFDGNRLYAIRSDHTGDGYHTIAGPPRHHRNQPDATAGGDGSFWRYSSQESGFSGRSDARDGCGSEGTLATSDYDGDCFSADDYKRFHHHRRPPDGLEHDTDPSG